VEIFEDHPVQAWRKILTWLKSMDVDYIIAVISPRFRDFVWHDWPFPYVCDLPKYPEAKMFPPEILARHRVLTNQVVDIAAEMGIDVYFSHFNFAAPRGFIEAHKRLYDKYRKTRGQGTVGHDQCNFMGTILGNICWNDPIYRNFMQYCWEEFFKAVPKARGFMVTPGEHADCQCPKCRGPALAEDAVRTGIMSTKQDFIRTFVDAMTRLGRESLVRTWGLGADSEDFPKATAYMPKYHVFDCFDAPIDPGTEQVMTSGRPIHLTFVQNGENNSSVSTPRAAGMGVGP